MWVALSIKAKRRWSHGLSLLSIAAQCLEVTNGDDSASKFVAVLWQFRFAGMKNRPLDLS